MLLLCELNERRVGDVSDDIDSTLLHSINEHATGASGMDLTQVVLIAVLVGDFILEGTEVTVLRSAEVVHELAEEGDLSELESRVLIRGIVATLFTV